MTLFETYVVELVELGTELGHVAVTEWYVEDMAPAPYWF